MHTRRFDADAAIRPQTALRVPQPRAGRERPGSYNDADHARANRRYDRAHGHLGAEDRRGLGRRRRNAVPRSAEAPPARLWPRPAPGPRRVRDLRDAVARARQRHPRLPCAERRCPCRRCVQDATARKHARRLWRRRSRPGHSEGARLVGRDDRARQGVRHRSVLRRLHQPARRLPRHDRAVVDRSVHRQAVRVRLSRDHRRRHGAHRARGPRRAGHRPAGRGGRRVARRYAGVRVGDSLSRSGRRGGGDRQHARHPRRRASPGTRSPATPSWPTPRGRAATTTAPAASRTRAWAWRGWSAT